MCSFKNAQTDKMQDYLINKARESLKENDSFMAKSWFLTASSLYPNSFNIQFQRYLLGKKEENISECCKIFTQLLALPEKDSLNNEIEHLVDAVKSTSNNPANQFYKQLFQSLSTKLQYNLLLKVANKCDDKIKRCQLMMLTMKFFPDKINEHALNLVDLIINEEKFSLNTKTNFSKDYFSKLLIFEVFPLILSKVSNLQLSTEQVEKLLENLFKIFLQQSSIGKVTDNETLFIECASTMDQMQNKLREIFNLIKIKMQWESLNIFDELTLASLEQQYDQLKNFYKKYSIIPVNRGQFCGTNTIDIKILKQVFYITFMLFLVYLDKYIKITVSNLVVIQQESTNLIDQKNLNTKKRKLYELKNAPICTNNELQTAFTGTNKIFGFLNQDLHLQQELFRIIELIGLNKCKSYETFIIDTHIYRGDNESLLRYFKEKTDFSLKSCIQLVNSSFITNNYPLTLEYTVKLVNMISNLNENEFKSKFLDKKEYIIAENEKNQLTFINYNKSSILSYSINVIIKCLDELLLNINRPSDLGIGHVMVLSQYKWPTNINIFVKCLNFIKSHFSSSKFFYPQFMDYIFNTDILEEFKALAVSFSFKGELCIVKQTDFGSKVKTMTTRGVNKNLKEEIKNSLINQMRKSKIKLSDDLFINFINTELRTLSLKNKKK